MSRKGKNFLRLTDAFTQSICALVGVFSDIGLHDWGTIRLVSHRRYYKEETIGVSRLGEVQ